MNECIICGSSCPGEICETCQYQMDTGDTSDIRDRVAKFNNQDYEIDEVKNSICKYYKVDPEDICKQGRKQPYTQARHLFIYMLVRRFNFRPCDVVKMLSVDHASVSYICHKFDRKFEKNMAVEKVLFLLKY